MRKIYSDAAMEHLGQLAAEAETEDEAAEQFLPLIGMAAGKLLPIAAKVGGRLAAKAIPRIARAVSRATPHLTRSIGRIAKGLHRNPRTRNLLKTVPSIARRTVGSIARQAARGRRVTPRGAVLTLAKQTRRVLGHPGHRRHALRRHNHLERRFHRHMGRGARPHWRYGRGRRWAGRPRWYRGGAPTAGRPARPAAGGVAPGVAGPVSGGRVGRPVGGRCVCSACPTCGTAVSQGPPVQATPAPTYCRCCGQLIR